MCGVFLDVGVFLCLVCGCVYVLGSGVGVGLFWGYICLVGLCDYGLVRVGLGDGVDGMGGGDRFLGCGCDFVFF